MNWIKAKLYNGWLRLKKWAIAILVALGIIVAVPILPVEAVMVEFTYTRATEYTDATPMPLAEIANTNLYCNGALVVSEPGADEAFNPDMVPGVYDCYATHIDIYGRESGMSNTVQKTVLPGLPNPPVLN